ncbi:hypothetical protein DPMN_044745 [Dreissena polymorpha]|uniref:Secreted protein n=1 Tax=Dreissena polymorpha TaxID=45954 RepID=A0A9D4D2Z0_DREPO|nr:hypothetical protein DPMN_044745 [Dreissena polymorpha]
MASLLRLNFVLSASIATLLRLWRSYYDQNAINKDAGVTGRRKTAFLPKKSLPFLLRIRDFQKHSLRSP